MTTTSNVRTFSLYKGLNIEGDPYYSKAEVKYNDRLGYYQVTLEYHDNDFLDAMNAQTIGQIRETTDEGIIKALLKTGYTENN